MNRSDFLKTSLNLSAMMTLGGFKTLSDSLAEDGEMMPALFIGHGSPMNAIEENEFTLAYQSIIYRCFIRSLCAIKTMRFRFLMIKSFVVLLL
jgi:hypothetical protein